jgi:uncharacterized protein (DUF2267 family)
MSATGVEVFDKTLQTTNIWLNEITAGLGETTAGPEPDRRVAWHALGAVLRALRDRLPVDEAAHLGAQLPLLVRGLYYDQWHPAGTPQKIRDRDEFIARVGAGLKDTRPLDAEDTTRTVFRVLARHLDAGEITKVEGALPHEIRSMWQAERTRAAQPGGGADQGGAAWSFG